MARQMVPSNSSAPSDSIPARELTPSVDVHENDQEIMVVADLPGVAAEDLNIQLDLPELRLVANAKALDGTPVRYVRQFRVGSAVDAGKIGAELQNGTLRVHLPKAESHRTRKIEVRAL
jgi:HSP20 family protein